jgi:hypothetical protein
MIDWPQPGIARLFRPDGSPPGKTLGTAFLCHSSGLLVTCAHVLEKEVGVASGASPVALTIFASGQTTTARVLPKYWRASDREDIAVLQLDDLALIASLTIEEGESRAGPDKPVALPLGWSSHLRSEQRLSRPLGTYGFPRAKPVDGLPGVCHVSGVARDNGFEVFTTRAGEVSYGYSGSPVWDDELHVVVGVNVSIITPGADLGGRQIDTAFFIPVETIRAVCDLLALPEGQPYRSLDVFEEHHSKFYFGREKASAQLVKQLSESEIVAVVGVSGSGKSSLVRAGLKKGLEVANNRLLQRPRVVFRPGPDPLLAMFTALFSAEEKIAIGVGNALESIADGVVAKIAPGRRRASKFCCRFVHAICSR